MEGTQVHGLAVATGMTVAELEALPDDGHRHELIDGELFVTPAPSHHHQHVLLQVLDAVRAVAGDRRVFFSPLDVRHGPRTNVQPDLVVYGRVASAQLEPDGTPDQAPVPEVLVEVSSPSTRRLDLLRKRELYERMGVAEYWFVDRDAGAVDVHVLGPDGRYGPPRTASGDQPPRSDALPVTVAVEQLLAW